MDEWEENIDSREQSKVSPEGSDLELHSLSG